ncbi:MAG: hypothetical protein SPK25_06335, partial [Eubacteriales bacterium]|nr:hypothetical protein [Eubacteriales bacterium]
KEGCEKYLDDCRQRNLREGTMRHYKQSYTQFYKVISPDLQLEEFTEKTYTDVCTDPKNDGVETTTISPKT